MKLVVLLSALFMLGSCGNPEPDASNITAKSWDDINNLKEIAMTYLHPEDFGADDHVHGDALHSSAPQWSRDIFRAIEEGLLAVGADSSAFAFARNDIALEVRARKWTKDRRGRVINPFPRAVTTRDSSGKETPESIERRKKREDILAGARARVAKTRTHPEF